MDDYRGLRRAGVEACRRYRGLLRVALDRHRRAAERGDAKGRRVWSSSAVDWHRRLVVEQRLLAQLRSGGVGAWRALVLELPVGDVEALIASTYGDRWIDR